MERIDIKKLSEDLEKLIDKYNIDQDVNIMLLFSDTLNEICHAKAEHLRVNWQDEKAAEYWETSAIKYFNN